MKQFFINYDKAADASCIEWVSNDYSITDLQPYIEAILCDDGEEYVELCSDEFKLIQIDNFAAMPGDEDGTFLLCYTAVVAIELDKFPEFRDALEASEGIVEVKVGFKDDSGKKIDDDLYEGFYDKCAELEEM